MRCWPEPHWGNLRVLYYFRKDFEPNRNKRRFANQWRIKINGVGVRVCVCSTFKLALSHLAIVTSEKTSITELRPRCWRHCWRHCWLSSSLFICVLLSICLRVSERWTADAAEMVAQTKLTAPENIQTLRNESGRKAPRKQLTVRLSRSVAWQPSIPTDHYNSIRSLPRPVGARQSIAADISVITWCDRHSSACARHATKTPGFREFRSTSSYDSVVVDCRILPRYVCRPPTNNGTTNSEWEIVN